jgi:hypothetical protein
MRRRRYGVLLALLVAALALQSLDQRTGIASLLSDVLRAVLGLAIFLVVFQRRSERVCMAVILAAIIAIGLSRDATIGWLGPTVPVVFHTLMALFLWAAVGVILRELFHKRSVDPDNVLGAICGYLIAGSAFAALNALTWVLMPTAYSVSPDLAPYLSDWHGRLALFSYYSLSQMLTIGYADVTPLRAPATTLSLFSVLFGVFYMAVVVSQFIGLAQRMKSRQIEHD